MKKWNLLAAKLSELQIVQQLTQKQQEVAALRPFSADLEGRIMQKLRLDWNYHSNAIEGNPMSYGETITYLMYGLTAKGKTLKDHLDIRGHNEAIYLMASIVKEERGFSEADIRELHSIILVEPYHSKAITPDGSPTQKLIQLGQYKTQPNHVKTPTGELHRYAEPEDVPIMMGELMEWYRSTQGKPLHPAVIAALFHHRFVNIHPFDDGNGRLGRILMNLILMQHGYPPAIIKLKDRAIYIDALINANTGDYELLINYICESLNDSLDIYLRAARGERVEEMGDVDKEIALFVGSFEKKDTALIRKTPETCLHILKNSIFPFLDALVRKLDELAPLFLDVKTKLELNNRYNYEVDKNGNNFVNILKKHQETKPDFEFSNIKCTYQYDGFKKGKEPFDFEVEIKFAFNKMQYILYDYDKKHFGGNKTFFYSQMISPIERNEFISKIVKAVIQEIQKRYVA